jgi:hypothetical protein
MNEMINEIKFLMFYMQFWKVYLTKVALSYANPAFMNQDIRITS